MEHSSNRMHIPEHGTPGQELLATIDQYKAEDINWKEGRAWSLVYYLNEEHLALLQKAHERFFSESTLNPIAFKSIKKMEQQVVEMTAQLLNGGPNAVGTMTSGGTESLFLMLFTYRERARKEQPHITSPEIVMPLSAHPAIEKAAHILGIKIRKAKLDKKQRVIPASIEKQINENTILLVSSAPAYPHGVLDPIEQVGAIAQKHNLPLHIDACIGGFMLPWLRKLGYPIPHWNFEVPGVTSISADAHKFAFGSKGSSVLVYRNMDFLKYQFYVSTEWPGGVYGSTTLLGTRSGGPVATAWTAMQALGEAGYLKMAKELMEGAEKIRKTLRQIPEIEIVGQGVMNIVAFTTKNNKPDIFVIGEQLEDKGWLVDRQQKPSCIHLTVMPQNVPIIDEYLHDLQVALAYAKANPKATAKGKAAMYGLMARIPFRGLVEDNVRQFFVDMYKSAANTSKEVVHSVEQAPEEISKFMGSLNRILSKGAGLKSKLKHFFSK